MKFLSVVVQFFFIYGTIFLLIACENNLREVSKITISEFSPSGDADDFVLKYTDSAQIIQISDDLNVIHCF
jgi:large-conductance mechanosensitive channel